MARLYLLEQKVIDFDIKLMCSIYAVGYFDVSSSRNLIVAASPNFASLVFEELSESKKLIPLDILTPTYEGGVNCCSFNDISDAVAVSVGSQSVYLLDMLTHQDVFSFNFDSALNQLQRGLTVNSWLGNAGGVVVSLDSRDSRPNPLISSVNTFSLSPDKT